MSNITFLGLGAMGSRMAKKLISEGHDVTVWNRTFGVSEELVELGGRAADSPRKAAVNADYVLSMVRDDAASSSVWLDEHTGALAGMKKGAIAIECSTVTPDHIRRMKSLFDQAKIALLDAPVAGSRPQADGGNLIFFVGGNSTVLERSLDIFNVMGSAVHHAGKSGAGATVKLMVNALFGAQLAQMGELLSFSAKCGLDRKTALEILAATPVCSPAAALAGQAMLKGNFAPAFPIDLVVKDFGLAAKAAEMVDAELPMSKQAGHLYAGACEQGYSADNITGIFQLFN